MSSGVVGFDLETWSDRSGYLHPTHTELALVQIALPDGRVFVADDGWSHLKWLENPDVTKVGHNLQYDISQLKYHTGIDIREGLYDTLIVEGMLNAARPAKIGGLSLADVTFWHLGEKRNKDIRKEFETGSSLTPEMVEYAAKDAHDVLRIRREQLKQLEIYQPSETVFNLEHAVLPVIAKMTFDGIHVNKRKWASIAAEYESEIADLEVSLSQRLTGGYQAGLWGKVSAVNFKSHHEIKRLLRENGIATLESTARDVLIEEAVGFAPNTPERVVLEGLIRLSKLYKATSTYGIKWLDHVDPATNRAHTSIFQTKAETGRISSFGPNITNIPKDELYRRCFTAEYGNVMIVADYGQQEARINAFLSDEERLLDGFEQRIDPYVVVARHMFGDRNIEKSDPERRVAKTIFLGLSYGMGKVKLAYQLGTSLSEAQQHLTTFKNTFPRLYSRAEEVVAQAEVDGYAETVIGRRRYGDPLAPGFVGKMRNHPIQGSAADMMKLAAVLVHREIEGRCAMLVDLVHDECVIETARKEARQVAYVVKKAMLTAARAIVDMPFEVDVKIIPTWGG